MNGLAAVVIAGLMPVLSQVEKVTRIHWPKGESPAMLGAALLIVSAVLIVLVVLVARKLARMVREPAPRLALFVELARAHGLSRQEEKLLRETARREKLSSAAKIFVEKRHLEAYAKSSTEAAYRQLYEKLFGR